jgi:hypothetical protein
LTHAAGSPHLVAGLHARAGGGAALQRRQHQQPQGGRVLGTHMSRHVGLGRHLPETKCSVLLLLCILAGHMCNAYDHTCAIIRPTPWISPSEPMRKFWKSLHRVDESCAYHGMCPTRAAPLVPAAMHNEAAAGTTASTPGWQDAGVWIVKVCKHPLNLLVCHCWGRGSGGGYQTVSKILLLQERESDVSNRTLHAIVARLDFQMPVQCAPSLGR